MSIKRISFLGTVLLSALLMTTTVQSEEPDTTLLARGKYIVQIGGCNDCHTAGFAAGGATTPEAQWLAGDSLGFRGPWGTTYALNLRNYMRQLDEDTWITVAKSVETRPPMPWWALNEMTEDDLKALYWYIRSLGPADNDVPAYVPPKQDPATPYVLWPAPPE